MGSQRVAHDSATNATEQSNSDGSRVVVALAGEGGLFPGWSFSLAG